MKETHKPLKSMLYDYVTVMNSNDPLIPMKKSLKRIIIDYLYSRIDKEEAISALITKNVSIEVYNSVLFSLIKNLRRMQYRVSIKKGRQRIKNYIDETASKCITKEQNIELITKPLHHDSDFNRMFMMSPSIFLEGNDIMSTDEDIWKKIKLFANYFGIRVKPDKRLFWVIKWACKEFIKKDMKEVSKK